MWEGDGRRATLQEFANDAQSQGKHFLYVRIPGNVQPVERGERFEDPLDAALVDAGVGTVTGGGSQMGDDDTVEFCGIDVVVSDCTRGVAVIRQVLREAACPPDAVIEDYVPQYRELSIWGSDDAG